ncbi:MAG: type II toxin-antitoxin system VapC family toxin [Sporichthyaceae bacterium]
MSFLLDTNVVSELRKPRCDENVRRWIAGADRNGLYTSVIVGGELRTGVERLRWHDPVQADRLDRWLVEVLDGFGPRVLQIDEEVADRWGRLNGTLGPFSHTDGLIAATAAVHGLTVVTRNVAHFERTGVPVVDPWLGP